MRDIVQALSRSARPSPDAGFAVARPLLPDYVALNAKWRAGHPAFICGDEVLSWGAFAENVNRVAHGLLAAGLKPRDAVGVVMDNGLAMAEAMWGVITAGMAVVPLNTSLTDDAMAAMMGDADVRAIFASGAYVGRLDALRTQLPGVRAGALIAADGVRNGWLEYAVWRDAQSAIRPNIAIDPDDVCNIIYSSGTTGRPKGIVHPHQRRLDWAYDLALSLRYHSGSVALASVGMYSNIVWASMLPTMIAGGTVVIMPKFDARQALELIARRRITNTAMVPLQYRMMLDADDPSLDVSSVQAIMSAGSPLWEDLKRDLIARFGSTIIELYGLTEGLITTLDPEDASRKLASVGKPVLGTDLRIVDDVGRDVAKGETGEIIGYGRIVMAGYHNRPEATREAMLVDEEGREWLKTGDLGKLDDEGFLYIVGRKKDMIVSGGQNIYPADIEAVAIKHPDAADVTVIGIPHDKWGETPFLLVVPKTGSKPDAAEIMAWVNARVGKQQRVYAAELREQLPRNPNGKVLKNELRAPYWPKV